jgi:hypothetical protein
MRGDSHSTINLPGSISVTGIFLPTGTPGGVKTDARLPVRVSSEERQCTYLLHTAA